MTMAKQIMSASFSSITKKPLRKLFRPHRIIIMRMLEDAGEEGISFRQLKSVLKLTDGNLATHLRSLENEGYITFEKVIDGHKVKTVYRLTGKGKEILGDFVEQLSKVLLSSDSKSQ